MAHFFACMNAKLCVWMVVMNTTHVFLAVNASSLLPPDDQVYHAESSIVEPKQIRVMLPVEDKDRERHIPVIMHKAIHPVPVIPEAPGKFGNYYNNYYKLA